MQAQGHAKLFKTLRPACSLQVQHNTVIYRAGLFKPLLADNSLFVFHDNKVLSRGSILLESTQAEVRVEAKYVSKPYYIRQTTLMAAGVAGSNGLRHESSARASAVGLP